jgi:hypothetical protein
MLMFSAPRITINVTDRMSVIVPTSYAGKRNMQLATSEITIHKGNDQKTASILHLIVPKILCIFNVNIP